MLAAQALEALAALLLRCWHALRILHVFHPRRPARRRNVGLRRAGYFN
jgi:hypothetical protein